MKREDFIKIGTAGIAGAAMGTFNRAESSGSTVRRHQRGPLKKGFMLETFPSNNDLSLREKFLMLREAGFAGVEPSSGLDRNEVLEAADEAGLEIPSVVASTHWTYPLSSPDRDTRMEGLRGARVAIEDAAAYGAKTVLLVPGRVTEDVHYDDAYRQSLREIRKLVPIAEENRVTIAIENVWNQMHMSPMEAARYVDEFESPWVGWYFDIGNMITFGYPHHWIKTLGRRIAMIHIKEFSLDKRDEEGLRRGFQVNYLEGSNDWARIMQALRDIGYGGYGIAEPPWQPDGVSAEEWLSRYVSDRMDDIFEM